MTETIADLKYDISANIAPLQRDLMQVETQWKAFKTKIEGAGIKAKVSIDTQAATRDLDALFRKLERSVKPIKVTLDTSDAERKLTALTSRMSVLAGARGVQVVGSVQQSRKPVIGAGKIAEAALAGVAPFAEAAGLGLPGVAALGAAAPIVGRVIEGNASHSHASASPAPMMTGGGGGGFTGHTAAGKTCPQCHNVNPPEAVFCRRCGYDFRGGVFGRIGHSVAHSMPYRVARETAGVAYATGQALGEIAGVGVGVAKIGYKGLRAGYRGMKWVEDVIAPKPKATLGDIHEAMHHYGATQVLHLENIHKALTSRPPYSGGPDTGGNSGSISPRDFGYGRGGFGGGRGGGGGRFESDEFGGSGFEEFSRVKSAVLSQVERSSRRGGFGGHAIGIESGPGLRIETMSEGLATRMENMALETGENLRVTRPMHSGLGEWTSRPARIGRVTFKQPVDPGHLSGIPFDPEMPSSMSAMQIAKVRGESRRDAEIRRAFSDVTGEGTNIPAHLLGPMGQPSGSFAAYSGIQGPIGPRLANGSFNGGFGGVMRGVNGMGGMGRWFGRYENFLQQQFGLSPGMARFGSALSAGGTIIAGANVVANGVANYQNNVTQAQEIGRRGGDFRYMAGLSRDQLISGTLGNGDNRMANGVSSFDHALLGGALTNIAGTFSGANAAIDRSLAGARYNNEKSDAIRQVRFGQRSSALSLASAANMNPLEDVRFAGAEQVEDLKQQQEIEAEDAMAKGGKVRRDKVNAIFERRKMAAATSASKAYSRGILANEIDVQSIGAQTGANTLNQQARGLSAFHRNFDASMTSLDAEAITAQGQYSAVANSEAAQLDPRRTQMARQQLNDTLGGISAQRAGLRSDQMFDSRQIYRGARAMDSRVMGNNFRASNIDTYSKYADLMRNNPDQRLYLNDQYHAEMRGNKLNDALGRVDARLGTAAINSSTAQQGYLNQGLGQTAAAQGIVDQGIADITRTNIDMRGDEFKDERAGRIAAIKANAASRLKGITNQLMYGNRGEFVSGYTTRGDAANLSFQDLGGAQKIADAATGALDSAVTKTDVTAQGAQGGGFSGQKADRVVTLLETIANNIGVQ